MNNILLIDDNIPLLESLADLIGTALKDCTILTARNGSEGIATMDSVPVALILTDLDMPVVNGYGVINHRNNHCQQVPLFVMSGSLSPEVRERLGGLCVSGCIEKPFYFEQLTERIQRALMVESIDGVKSRRSLLQPAEDRMVCA